MSNKDMAVCRGQKALLTAYLSEGAGARFDTELRSHLEQCVSCQRYWESLCAVRSGFPETPLYSPALKQRTLRRMASPRPATGAKWLPLVVPAALLSLSISLLIPGWLLSRLFQHWTSSAALAYGAGYGVLMFLGTLVTVAAGVSLAERGHVGADGGEGCST